MDDIERFEVKYKRVGECDEWQCGKFKDGYGAFYFRAAMYKAHRVVWILTNGEIPEGLFVLHACDNRSCVRIEHLFLGTAKDNAQDMMSKDRNRYGYTTSPIKHGTAGGYTNRNCRCRECTKANSEKSRERRARKFR